MLIKSSIVWLVLSAEPSFSWITPFALHRSSPLTQRQAQEGDWSVADDWGSLSSENPVNSAPDSSDIFNQDIANNAAQSILADNHDENIEPLSEEDVWLNEVIEDILSTPLSSTPLYDTGSLDPQNTNARRQKMKTPKEKQLELEQLMEDEIAMLVRCNESPEEHLVRAGKSIPPLTMEQKQDVSQLVKWKGRKQKAHWRATPFFKRALAAVFRIHAKPNTKDDSQTLVMDAKSVSTWMSRSIGEELGTYTEKTKHKGKDMTSEKKSFKIAPHDSRVLRTLTQYSAYGTGYLTLENLESVYMEALTRLPHEGKEFKGDIETLQLRNAENIRQVWRDLNNHKIVGPNEHKWDQNHEKLQEQYGSLEQQTRSLLESGEQFMDECEIMEYGAYEPPPTEEQVELGHDTKNHKYIKKSSHEQVKLAKDGKTPLYINEGDFVFIDEESCIGCMQCVNEAPSNFLMMETGRARTFHQRHGADVQQGVAACPVSCMHYVSFDELQELETVRDKGDGRSDHKHMNHRRGHTPLYVAGIDSDNNHRSSWYHHLKNKCCTSGRCPQRGCFDCPSYKQSGGNPYFQKKAKEGQHVRAQYFIDKGDVDLWRKTVDL